MVQQIKELAKHAAVFLQDPRVNTRRRTYAKLAKRTEKDGAIKLCFAVGCDDTNSNYLCREHVLKSEEHWESLAKMMSIVKDDANVKRGANFDAIQNKLDLGLYLL